MDQANICLIHFYKRVSHLSLLSSTCHDGQSSQSRGTAQAPHVRLLPVDERDWQDQWQREEAAGGEGEVRGRHEGVVGERRRGGHEAGEEGDPSQERQEGRKSLTTEAMMT